VTEVPPPSSGAPSDEGAATEVAPSDAAPSDAAIVVRNLVKRYRRRAAVDGVSFEVARGEVFALLGPNGAGKTTTVEIIEGYRGRDRGDVQVLGKDPRRGGRVLRAQVGLMLQQGGFEPRARAVEIVRLFAAFHADPRNPDELIDLVGLREVSRTRYRLLSGGERQRLALAVALVGRPEVLILDEPTAGMDPAARAATRQAVLDLRGEGIAVLMTTHDLVDVERVADRVAILVRGRIIASGTPADLSSQGRRLNLRFGRPLSNEDVATLRGTLSQGWPGMRAERTVGDSAGAVIDGVRTDPALVAATSMWAASRGLQIVELRAASGSLEDRYLELTGDTAAAASTSAGDDA
jgi:ABC-2 type transport system ATP-binding protein